MKETNKQTLDCTLRTNLSFLSLKQINAQVVDRVGGSGARYYAVAPNFCKVSISIHTDILKTSDDLHCLKGYK